MNKLSHLDGRGQARMVDVGKKPLTKRTATAQSRVVMAGKTFERIIGGDVPKGDVFAVGRIAGIQAAKRTPELIPLCHPLSIDNISVEITPEKQTASLLITAEVTCSGRTGVEMEALTAVTIAALAVYDMCKSLDKSIEITDVCLLRKSGGKSGKYVRKP